MSNPSLREQLAALSNESPSAGAKKDPVKKSITPKPPRKEPKPIQKAVAPAWLEQARYGVELLRAHFPLCFGERDTIRPLKTGIRQDLVKQLGSHEDIALGDKACMVSSLAYYVNSVNYHKSVTEGAHRVDLFGAEAGQVTAEEAQYSRQRLETKWQKRQGKSSQATQQPASKSEFISDTV